MGIRLPNQDMCAGCGNLKLEISDCGMCGAPCELQRKDPEAYAQQREVYKAWEAAGFPGEKLLSPFKRDQVIEV